MKDTNHLRQLEKVYASSPEVQEAVPVTFWSCVYLLFLHQKSYSSGNLPDVRWQAYYQLQPSLLSL